MNKSERLFSCPCGYALFFRHCKKRSDTTIKARVSRLWAALSVLILLVGAPVAKEAAPEAEEKKAKLWLGKVESALNKMTTLTANFTQVSYTTLQKGQTSCVGETKTGRLFLWRPGRMRLVYTAQPKEPSEMLVADGKRLILYNPAIKDDSPYQVYTLKDTPVYLLLKKKVSFEKDVKVLRVDEQEKQVAVQLQVVDGDLVTLTLFFKKTPQLEISGWAIKDSSDMMIHVALDTVKTGMLLDKKLFKF